jgi:hypothetical protein
MVFLGRYGSSRNIALLREFSSPAQEFHSFLTQKCLVIRCIIMQVMVSAFWSCFFMLDLLLLLSLYFGLFILQAKDRSG